MTAHSLSNRYLVWLLVTALLLAACSASVEQASMDGYRGEVPAESLAESMPDEAKFTSSADAGQNSASPTERMVIKDVSLSLAVDDPSASLDRISSLAEDTGGYVVSANIYQTRLSDGQKVPQGSITVRIPAERLQEALTRIKAETSLPVISENISSQDVTSEYTDLASQVRNLEAAEKQLQAILDRATKTEDVLRVFNELTRVRGDIEVLRGRMKYYEQSAALSAVHVELVPNAAVQPVTIGGWQPQGVARDAVQALVNTLKGLATAAIWLVIYVLPVLLVIFTPLILIIVFIRRWRRSHAKAPVIAPPASTPE